jgi:hypothetical protein
MMCVLVYRSNKAIEIFFTSLCVAMSFICGCVIGSVIDGDISSSAYLEGRPIGSLMRFSPLTCTNKKKQTLSLLFFVWCLALHAPSWIGYDEGVTFHSWEWFGGVVIIVLNLIWVELGAIEHDVVVFASFTSTYVTVSLPS